MSQQSSRSSNEPMINTAGQIGLAVAQTGSTWEGTASDCLWKLHEIINSCETQQKISRGVGIRHKHVETVSHHHQQENIELLIEHYAKTSTVNEKQGRWTETSIYCSKKRSHDIHLNEKWKNLAETKWFTLEVCTLDSIRQLKNTNKV